MSEEIVRELVGRVARLQRRLDDLEAQVVASAYKGTKGSDFTTTELAHHGDYGYQTADAEVQVNCNGTIRAIATAAL